MKKITRLFVLLIAALFLISCSISVIDKPVKEIPGMAGEPEDIEAWEAKVNADFEAVMRSLGTEGVEGVFSDFDARYNGELSKDFARDIRMARSAGKGNSKLPTLDDMPFNVDGAVYLSGGSADLLGSIIGWVAPKNFPGGFYHGAVLDLDKVDANNPDALSLQTAITKGAGYESVSDWRSKINAMVLNPKNTLNKTKLDSAQEVLHNYCKPDNKNMEYGFFKGAVNIFKIVDKWDNYTWYCTKVVWRMFDKYGIDVDSNDKRVDFTKSGLYSLVKNYYKTIYFYSSKKANTAIDNYIDDAMSKIVLAEEIMLSPYFTKVYEKIREN